MSRGLRALLLLVVSISGCSSPTQVAGGLLNPADVSVDSTQVYWTAQNGLFRCDKSSCAAPTTIISTSPTHSWFDGSDVYWGWKEEKVFE